MTINFMTGNATAAGETGRGAWPGRRWLTVPGVVGVAYTLSWIAGLSIAAPSPSFGASGTEVVSALAGHGPVMAVQFALTEGLPAAGIAVVSAALADLARRHGAVTAGWLALVAGLTAAVISVLQFGLGLALTATSSPGTAHLLYAAVNRMDGGKMLVLAVLGAAGAAMRPLPGWLRYTGIALALALTASGVVYLLLLASLAAAAGPALVLLLLFITGGGIITGRQDRSPGARDS